MGCFTRWMEGEMRRSLGLLAVGLLVVTGSGGVPALSASQPRPRADTTRLPLRFGNATFFRPVYLSRAADAALAHYRGDPSSSLVEGAPPPVRVAAVAAAAPEEPPRASAFARRYGIERELAEKILDVALAEGVDPELAFRLVRVESGFEPGARGPAGALGLTQLMLGTARTVDRSVDTRAELLDPGTNLRIGFRYLRQMIERYDGDVRLGVLAYNRGEVAVDRALKRGRDPENGYSRKVLGPRGGVSYEGKGLVKK
jgi:soluble lytic murein transglycosylase-like protein